MIVEQNNTLWPSLLMCRRDTAACLFIVPVPFSRVIFSYYPFHTRYNAVHT